VRSGVSKQMQRTVIAEWRVHCLLKLTATTARTVSPTCPLAVVQFLAHDAPTSIHSLFHLHIAVPLSCLRRQYLPIFTRYTLVAESVHLFVVRIPRTENTTPSSNIMVHTLSESQSSAETGKRLRSVHAFLRRNPILITHFCSSHGEISCHQTFPGPGRLRVTSARYTTQQGTVLTKESLHGLNRRNLNTV
jgi:hypothetical protein